MELNGDWLTQALSLLEAARKEVRLTLPPGQAASFWTQVLERARLIPTPLRIDVLLPANPLADDGLPAAIDALSALDISRHTVSVSATRSPMPWFVMIADGDRALAAVGDAYAGDDIFLVQQLSDPARVTDMRASFDRRFQDGELDPDLKAWASWLERFPTRREARSAVRHLDRGREKLADVAGRVLRRLPKRQCWLIKPAPGAWGMPDKQGLPFDQWLEQGSLHLGWPALAELFSPDADPDLDDLARHLADRYPDVEDGVRVRATARHFLRDMRVGDRVLAVDGWTVKQEAPVRVHAWGQVMSDAERSDAPWPWQRVMAWQDGTLELPVTKLREVSGLQSATYPLHRIDPATFRRLVDTVEARREKSTAPQLSLTLDLFPPYSQGKSLF